jgi:hypothetical protein
LFLDGFVGLRVVIVLFNIAVFISVAQSVHTCWVGLVLDVS